MCAGGVGPEESRAEVVDRSGAGNWLASDDLHVIDQLAPVNHDPNRGDGTDIEPAFGLDQASRGAAIEHPHLTESCDDAQSFGRWCVATPFVSHQRRP